MLLVILAPQDGGQAALVRLATAVAVGGMTVGTTVGCAAGGAIVGVGAGAQAVIIKSKLRKAARSRLKLRMFYLRSVLSSHLI